MSQATLLDANGHLSAAGFVALQSAPVGQAPPEVARHLAACGVCQGKLLQASAPGPRPKPGRRPMPLAPSPGRTAFLVLVTLAFVLLGLWSLRRLVEP